MADRAPRFGITLVASFTAFAASLLLTPVMARLFPPAEYGGFAVTNMIATIAASAAQFSLTNALACSRSLATRMRLTIVLLRLSAMGAVLTLVVSALIATVGKDGATWSQWWFVVSCPILMLAIAIGRIVTSWSISFADFRGQAYARMVYATSGRGIAIAAGFAGLSKAWVMVAAEAAAFVLQSLLLVRGRVRAFARLWRRGVGPVRLGEEMRRHRTFSHFDYASQLLLLLGGSAPVVVVGWVHGATSAGLLSLAMSLVSIPVALIALAIAPAMLDRLTGAWREGDTSSKRRVMRDFLVIAGISLAGYAVLAILAPTVFPILLGHRWTAAGPLASLLCLPLSLSFIATPFYAILWHSGLARIKMRIDVALTIVEIAALALPLWHSADQAILAWAIVWSMHRMVDLAMIVRSIRSLGKAST